MISWRGSRSWQGTAARARRYCPAKITTVSACWGHPIQSARWTCPFTKRSSGPITSRRIYSTTSLIMRLLKIMVWLPGIHTAWFSMYSKKSYLLFRGLIPLRTKTCRQTATLWISLLCRGQSAKVFTVKISISYITRCRASLFSLSKARSSSSSISTSDEQIPAPRVSDCVFVYMSSK